MKFSELQDGDELVTRTELRETMLSLHEDLLAIKNQLSDLRETIRNKWWIPVAVAVITTIGTAIIAHR